MSTPTLAALLSLPRFRSVCGTFVLMAKTAGITDESALAHGVNAIRSELGRVFPGGEFRRVGTVGAKSGTLSASTKGESKKGLADSPALWVARISLAVEALANEGVSPSLEVNDIGKARIRLLCGIAGKK